jgi:fatty acid desaturase
VKEAGLLDRRTGYYWRVFAVLAAAFIGCWAAFAVLGDTWWQLLVAAALGVVFTQFAFLSHEAGHNQVFASRRWNENAARYGGVLLAGISYAWWMNKHTRHHGNPNTVGKDPDISFEAISFRTEDAARKRGLLRVLVRVQGYAFFPMILLEGVNLHWQAVRTFVSGEDVTGRWFEAGVFTARFVVYFGVLFWFLPLGTAFAFIGVQMAVFGLYMGISFAPNHKGMPVIEHDQKVDFLSRQVLTSRNISGGRFVTHFMGGLNHQVEHHLFPNMARPNLACREGPRAGALRRARRAVHGDHDAPVLRHPRPVPQPGRSGRAGPVRLSDGRAVPRPVTGSAPAREREARPAREREARPTSGREARLTSGREARVTRERGARPTSEREARASRVSAGPQRRTPPSRRRRHGRRP